jgi:hypothetical protein
MVYKVVVVMAGLTVLTFSQRGFAQGSLAAGVESSPTPAPQAPIVESSSPADPPLLPALPEDAPETREQKAEDLGEVQPSVVEAPEAVRESLPAKLEPEAWLAAMRDKKGVLRMHPGIPRLIAFVKEFPKRGEPRLMAVDGKEIREQSFLTLVNPDQIAWSYRMNASQGGRLGPLETDKVPTRVLLFLKLTGADMVVHCPQEDVSKTGCMLYAASGDELRRVNTMSIPGGENADAARVWLRERLGYDAVVLARQGEYALVGGMASFPREGLQALALRGSERRLMIRGQTRDGLAVLQLVRQSGPWGVFKVVLPGQGQSVAQTAPVGTKLLVEGAGSH